MKKLIIFDCDGTLVDSEKVAVKAFTSIWAEHGYHISEEEFKEQFIGSGKNSPARIKLRQSLTQEVLLAAEDYAESEIIRNITPVPGMKEFVSKLDCKICVASNSSPSYLAKVLENSGLAHYFGKDVFSSHQVENPKPAPDLFLHVLETMGVSADEALVIEDSVPGIMAAHNAEIDVIGFTGASHFSHALVSKIINVNPTWHCQLTNEIQLIIDSINQFKTQEDIKMRPKGYRGKCI